MNRLINNENTKQRITDRQTDNTASPSAPHRLPRALSGVVSCHAVWDIRQNTRPVFVFVWAECHEPHTAWWQVQSPRSASLSLTPLTHTHSLVYFVLFVLHLLIYFFSCSFILASLSYLFSLPLDYPSYSLSLSQSVLIPHSLTILPHSLPSCLALTPLCSSLTPAPSFAYYSPSLTHSLFFLPPAIPLPSPPTCSPCLHLNILLLSFLRPRENFFFTSPFLPSLLTTQRHYTPFLSPSLPPVQGSLITLKGGYIFQSCVRQGRM